MRKLKGPSGARGNHGIREAGYRQRMRDHAVIVLRLLKDNRRISLDRIAGELGVCQMTARRWVDSFSLVMPIRVERGIVIVEQERLT